MASGYVEECWDDGDGNDDFRQHFGHRGISNWLDVVTLLLDLERRHSVLVP
jgi:hypothetical protein